MKLLNQPASPHDREHRVRFGSGAGVGPQRHDVFEERYGFPLLERWGMTGMARRLVDNIAPGRVGTRAFGHAVAVVQARPVDEADVEPVIRHSAEAARKDFISGYVDDPAAPEDVWCGGCSHTGAIVTRDATGRQSIRKHAIFAKNAAPRTHAGRLDLCALKQR